MKEQIPRQKMLSEIEKSEGELMKAYVKALLNLPIPKKKPPKKA